MLDIKYVAENIEEAKARLSRKGVEADWEKLAEMYGAKNKLQFETDNLKAERNKSSKQIGQLIKSGEKDKANEIKARMGEVGDKIKANDEEIKKLDEELKNSMLNMPNFPHDSVPDGKNELENVELKKWGTLPEFAFAPRDHQDIMGDLDMIDFKRGAKITGSGFPVYTGKGARLERALINFMLDYHYDNGFREVGVPFVVNRQSMTGTSQLPKFEEDLYRIDFDDLFLIPTAEVPVTNIHADEILQEEELPKFFSAYTPCFRREAGSYGKETKGLNRIHQFNKVEMVALTTQENSYEVQKKLLRHAEELLELLQLPYRVIELCSGDLSFGAAKCFDVEVWSPAQGKYLEISSVSNFEDFQARRANMRYRKCKDKPKFVHTLNGSGLATPRLMVAMIENYQTEKGFRVPDVLKKYLPFEVIE